jgi:hypothetical protein
MRRPRPPSVMAALGDPRRCEGLPALLARLAATGARGVRGGGRLAGVRWLAPAAEEEGVEYAAASVGRLDAAGLPDHLPRQQAAEGGGGGIAIVWSHDKSGQTSCEFFSSRLHVNLCHPVSRVSTRWAGSMYRPGRGRVAGACRLAWPQVARPCVARLAYAVYLL